MRLRLLECLLLLTAPYRANVSWNDSGHRARCLGAVVSGAQVTVRNANTGL